MIHLKFSCSSLLAFVLLFSDDGVNGQGCSNVCPPLNFGTEVPALCEGELAESFADIDKTYQVCHSIDITSDSNTFRIDDFRGLGKVTVFANYYTGCNAGRRESGVFAHVAQKYFDQYGDRTTFVQSVKGGGTCTQWAGVYQRDAQELFPNSDVTPREMPLSVNDENYEIRDDLFTTPFGHPSYLVLDGELRVRHKFIGPCCGYESYYDCTAAIATSLDTQLSGYIDAILAESGIDENTGSNNNNGGDSNQDGTIGDSNSECVVSDFSDWSPCSVRCGTVSGTQFRWRTILVQGNGEEACTSSTYPAVETRECQPETVTCNDEGTCIPEFGDSFSIQTVASGFDSPRDVAFHPTPGFHLGEYSEGRDFVPDIGEEAWVVNGANHSVSIVASLGTDRQTTISRRDRGYYHYMINGTALAFNGVSDSNRSPDRDGHNYWSICNDNRNNYVDTKEANYFMGPTLYNSDPRNSNVVNRLGEECRPEEPCYFLHADMLHEAPACIGIAHDPEKVTAYGNVYWAFDATGNGDKGQLVRFDFQQPHGPGSMDHSVAAIRRYVEVELERGPSGVHAGMMVHPTRREVYVAVPGTNKITVVGADSGSFARIAREEYPIFSNRLPSFDYSIWECAEQKDFATGIDMPTGLALSPNGERLFVAERGTGKILVFEISSGALLYSIATGFETIGGLAFSLESKVLHFVDDETNTLNSVQPSMECSTPMQSRTDASFEDAVNKAQAVLGDDFSLMRDYQCQVDPAIPDSSFFDQVHQAHEDSGYADDNPDVQGMAGMDETAALLANRTDCEPDSELNFDALLLGGYFCHVCLPEQDLTCDAGGTCSNVQWQGYHCDNEFLISQHEDGRILFQSSDGTEVIDTSSLMLSQGVTYRFTVFGDIWVCLSDEEGKQVITAQEGNPTGCAIQGPLLLEVTEKVPTKLILTVDGVVAMELSVQEAVILNNEKGDEGAGIKNDNSGLPTGAIVGLVVAPIIIASIVGIFLIRRCLKDDDEVLSKSSEITNQEMQLSTFQADDTGSDEKQPSA
jgi:hypothetical protein